MADAMQDAVPYQPVRETFAASDTVGHRQWVRSKVEASFYVPIILPDVKPARRRRNAAPVQRSLFELCGDPGSIQPRVVEAAELASVEPVMLQLSPLDHLVAAGITTPYRALRSALCADDTPRSPRSLKFPVRLMKVGDSYELILSTPACGDLPFVRHVENVSGLKAKWVPSHCKGGSSLGQWHHAVDLATDEGWERLASSMEHTTKKQVCKGVGFGIRYGYLSAENGRQLLSAVGIPEPESRACQNLQATPYGRLRRSLEGWEAVYAVEKELVVPGDAKRGTFAEVTAAGWRSIGKKPPTTKAESASAERPLSPSNRLTAMLEDAGLGRRPSTKQIALVETAIRDSLPPDVPSFARQIISVRQSGGTTAARIRLFDNEIGVLTFSGGPGAHNYAWEASSNDDRIFQYDFDLKAWTRIDEPVACLSSTSPSVATSDEASLT